MLCVVCQKAEAQLGGTTRIIHRGDRVIAVMGLPADTCEPCEACAYAASKRQRARTRDWSVVLRLQAETVINTARRLRHIVRTAVFFLVVWSS